MSWLSRNIRNSTGQSLVRTAREVGERITINGWDWKKNKKMITRARSHIVILFVKIFRVIVNDIQCDNSHDTSPDTDGGEMLKEICTPRIVSKMYVYVCVGWRVSASQAITLYLSAVPSSMARARTQTFNRKPTRQCLYRAGRLTFVSSFVIFFSAGLCLCLHYTS